MIRISLIAAALLVTAATATPAMAQAGALVRTLDPAAQATVQGSTVLIGERKAAPCEDKSCAGKALKRGYVGSAQLGW